MSPEVARLGHVALETPGLEESLSFYVDTAGLEVVERTDGTAYLRAVEEYDHHSLSLTEGDEAGIDHVGWQTEAPEHVAAFAEELEDRGLDVT